MFNIFVPFLFPLLCWVSVSMGRDVVVHSSHLDGFLCGVDLAFWKNKLNLISFFMKREKYFTRDRCTFLQYVHKIKTTIQICQLLNVPMYPHWHMWTHREGATLKSNAYNEIYLDKTILEYGGFIIKTGNWAHAFVGCLPLPTMWSINVHTVVYDVHINKTHTLPHVSFMVNKSWINSRFAWKI